MRPISTVRWNCVEISCEINQTRCSICNEFIEKAKRSQKRKKRNWQAQRCIAKCLLIENLSERSQFEECVWRRIPSKGISYHHIFTKNTYIIVKCMEETHCASVYTSILDGTESICSSRISLWQIVFKHFFFLHMKKNFLRPEKLHRIYHDIRI